MSVEHLRWQRRQTDLTLPQRAVLMCLCDRAGGDPDHPDWVWPSRETIASDTSACIKTVSRGLRDLQAAGCIQRVGTNGQVTIWAICLHRNPTTRDSQYPNPGLSVPRDCESLETLSTPTRDSQYPNPGLTVPRDCESPGLSVPQPGTLSPPTRDSQSPHRSITKQKEAETTTPARDASLDDPASSIVARLVALLQRSGRPVTWHDRHLANLRQLIDTHGVDLVAGVYADAEHLPPGTWPLCNGLGACTSSTGFDALAAQRPHRESDEANPTRTDQPDLAEQHRRRRAAARALEETRA